LFISIAYAAISFVLSDISHPRRADTSTEANITAKLC
jgi:hypothetical protein